VQHEFRRRRKIITIFGIKLPAKSWAIISVVIAATAIIIAIFAAASGGNTTGDSLTTSAAENPANTEVVSEEPTPVELGWYLNLVNAENPLDLDYSPQLERINTNFTRNAEIFYFHAFAVENLNAMLYSAQRADEYLFVITSYRSGARQEELFNDQVQRNINNGMNREDAETAATTRVARPGTSEHQTGLAVDLNLADQNFANTSRFRWLQENAHTYGFVLRYTSETEHITGMAAEPWHWRFVGPAHARVMNEQNLTLEEYVEKLLRGE